MSASVIALEEIPIINKMQSKKTQMVLKIPNHPKNNPPVSKDKQCKKLSKRLTMILIVFLANHTNFNVSQWKVSNTLELRELNCCVIKVIKQDIKAQGQNLGSWNVHKKKTIKVDIFSDT